MPILGLKLYMDIEKLCNNVMDELNPCYDIEASLRQYPL